MERDTKQRRAIRALFEKANRPLSPTEVLELGKEEVSGLGIATVYRSLKSLVDEKWLVPVQLPGEPDRYEPAGKHHHHHFHCRECKKVYEVEGCPGDLKKLSPRGFKLEGHELTLYGVCAACAK